MYVFKKMYGNFLYSFEDVDTKRLSLSESQQMVYNDQVSEWIKSDACKIELDGITRKFYRELATITKDDASRDAYRLVLVWINTYEKRLRGIADAYDEFKIIQKRQIKL